MGLSATGTAKQMFSGALIHGPWHEDIIDEIFEIDPTTTPFYNMIGDSKAESIQSRWTKRSLLLRQDNAQSEGRVYAIGDFENTVLGSNIENICQIFARLPRVTRSEAKSNAIGVGELLTDQVMYHQVGIKTDMEHALLRGSLNTGPTNNADTAVRRLDGAINAATYTTTLATTATFTEDMFNGFHENGWSRGAALRDTLVHGRVKRWISQMTASSTKYLFSEDKRLVNSIDVYESDFYLTRIALSHDIPAAAGPPVVRGLFMFDRDNYKKRWLSRAGRRPLALPSDGMEVELLGECTLEYSHPGSSTYATLRSHGTL